MIVHQAVVSRAACHTTGSGAGFSPSLPQGVCRRLGSEASVDRRCAPTSTRQYTYASIKPPYELSNTPIPWVELRGKTNPKALGERLVREGQALRQSGLPEAAALIEFRPPGNSG